MRLKSARVRLFVTFFHREGFFVFIFLYKMDEPAPTAELEEQAGLGSFVAEEPLRAFDYREDFGNPEASRVEETGAEGESKTELGEKPSRKDERGEWRDGDIRAIIAKEHGGRGKEWGVDDEINISGDKTYLNETDGKIYDLATEECLTDKEGKGSVNENENFRKIDEEMRRGLAEKGSYSFKIVDEKGTHVTFVRLEGQNNEIKYSHYLHPEQELVKLTEANQDDGSDEGSMPFDNGDPFMQAEPLVIDVNAELRGQLGMENSVGTFSNAQEGQTTHDEVEKANTIDTFSIASLFNGTSYFNTLKAQLSSPETVSKPEAVQKEVLKPQEKADTSAVTKKTERTEETKVVAVEMSEIKDEEIIIEDVAPEIETKEPQVKIEEDKETIISQDQTTPEEVVLETDKVEKVIIDVRVQEEMPTGIELKILPEVLEKEVEVSPVVEAQDVVIKDEIPKEEPIIRERKMEESKEELEPVKIVPVIEKVKLVKPEIKKLEKVEKSEETVAEKPQIKEEKIIPVKEQKPEVESREKTEKSEAKETSEKAPIISPYISRAEVRQESLQKVGVERERENENQDGSQMALEMPATGGGQEKIVSFAESRERTGILGGAAGSQSPARDEVEVERNYTESDPSSGITMRRAA
ncbi:MAG: hypothetical protein PHV93_03005 [Candidatus Pacebacteria bacterium]|nr:hypothetical protein [Candidatus Paceibacterota bacterium]